MSKKQERVGAVERQIERLERRINLLDAYNNRSWLQKLLIIFAGFIATVIMIRIVPLLGVLCIVGAVAGFAYVERFHERVRKSFLRHTFLLQVQRNQLARLQLDWENIPAVASRSEQSDHPFEIDLDITGARSLHQLINTGVSLEGRAMLREWLLEEVPDLDEIRERQAFIRELAPLRLFREKLMLNSLFATRVTGSQLDGQRILLWLEAKGPANASISTLIVPTILSCLTLVALGLFLVEHISPLYPIVGLLVSFGWYMYTRNQRGFLQADTAFLRNSFSQLQVIFEYLEKYPYAKQSNLKRLCEPFFRNPDNRPSVLLRQLKRVANFARFENADVLGLLINALVPLDVYASYFLHKIRARLVNVLPEWLDIWYELEALCSLANFAHLNPDYTMPRFLTQKQVQEQDRLFRAYGLGHPLLAEERKVINDFTMDTHGTLMLITGSNMAGKSTFLRTLGINLCLAYAGAPVNATSLETVLFELYACIKVTDSLSDGYSYFYAEVRRLRGLLDRLEEGTTYPTFFLIDEIFKGTNNRERLIGSTAYIHALVNKNCVGAISTHDLDLVKLADTLPQIRNYHFKEDVTDGKMVFSYKLRQGPCPTTNALKIMALEGLPTTLPA